MNKNISEFPTPNLSTPNLSASTISTSIHPSSDNFTIISLSSLNSLSSLISLSSSSLTPSLNPSLTPSLTHSIASNTFATQEELSIAKDLLKHTLSSQKYVRDDFIAECEKLAISPSEGILMLTRKILQDRQVREKFCKFNGKKVDEISALREKYFSENTEIYYSALNLAKLLTSVIGELKLRAEIAGIEGDFKTRRSVILPLYYKLQNRLNYITTEFLAEDTIYSICAKAELYASRKTYPCSRYGNLEREIEDESSTVWEGILEDCIRNIMKKVDESGAIEAINGTEPKLTRVERLKLRRENERKYREREREAKREAKERENFCGNAGINFGGNAGINFCGNFSQNSYTKCVTEDDAEFHSSSDLLSLCIKAAENSLDENLAEKRKTSIYDTNEHKILDEYREEIEEFIEKLESIIETEGGKESRDKLIWDDIENMREKREKK